MQMLMLFVVRFFSVPSVFVAVFCLFVVIGIRCFLLLCVFCCCFLFVCLLMSFAIAGTG